MTSTLTLESVWSDLRRFAARRDWARFHTPRNLALALAGEVGEVCQLLRWEGEQATVDPRIAAELADAAIFLFYLCDICGVDLASEMSRKIAENSVRFPEDG